MNNVFFISTSSLVSKSFVAHVINTPSDPTWTTNAFVLASANVKWGAGILLPCTSKIVANAISAIVYNGSGTIVLSGGASTVASISIDQSFNWGVSQGSLKWYRIQGKCLVPTCANSNLVTADNCGDNMQMMSVVAATSLTDLCNKLKAKNVIWSLTSIRLYSRNAVPTPDDSACENLIEQSFCEVPACTNLCVDFVFVETVGVKETLVEQIYEYNGSGNIVLSGASTTNATTHTYHGSGTIILSGAAHTSSPQWANYKYSGRGTIILSGSANNGSSNLTIPVETVGVIDSASITNVFLPTEFGNNLTINQGSVSSCGCSLPLRLNLSQNLTGSSVLNGFLARNGFVLPTNVTLLYSNNDDAWQQHYHFTGTSADGVQQERWSFYFTLFCSGVISGSDWEVQLLVRKDVVGGKGIFITRCVFTVPMANTCSTGTMNIAFNYDVLSKSTSGSSTVDSANVMDNIGIFGTRFWSNSKPSLDLILSQAASASTGAREDISSIFPPVPILN